MEFLIIQKKDLMIMVQPHIITIRIQSTCLGEKILPWWSSG